MTDNIHMKRLILIILFFVSAAYSKECIVETAYKPAAAGDCIHCLPEVKSPGEKASKLIAPLMDFVSNKSEQQEVINRYKGYTHFLNSRKNKLECSNYKAVAGKFQKDFQKELSECEKGPDLIDRRKIICEWVLNTYSDKITESFYAHWTQYDAKGNPQLIAGRTKEQLEGPIRSHEAWCRKVKNNYKQKMFISCGEVTDWVREFDIVKRVSESMKKDRETESAGTSTQKDRKSLFDEGCKYFENNPATTFTKDLYMECLTR